LDNVFLEKFFLVGRFFQMWDDVYKQFLAIWPPALEEEVVRELADLDLPFLLRPYFLLLEGGRRHVSMVGQTSCLSVQARCLHHPIHKRYFSNSHIPYLGKTVSAGNHG
jgi:hypothetical protein